MSTVQPGQFKSIPAAAKAFEVSKTTLFHRIQGRPSREDYTPDNKELSKIVEDALVKDILQIDAQGFSPALTLVRDMANTICRARGGLGVGVKCANNFIKRTPALNIQLERTYESQRRLFEDPDVIGGWFVLPQQETLARSLNPDLPCSPQESWLAKTPSNAQEVDIEATLIKKRLEKR